MTPPLNYLIIEEEVFSRLPIKNGQYYLHGLPLPMVQFANYIIITDSNIGCFKYIKNRHTGEININIPMSELPKHIRRINMNLGYPLTLYDRIYRYVRCKFNDLFNRLEV